MAEYKDSILGFSDKKHDSNKAEMEALALAHPRINFNELKRRASVAFSASCTHVKKLTKGNNHELFVLFFGSLKTPLQPEWSCIARFPQQTRSNGRMASELAAMRYVRSKTTIPVPEVYLYDFNPRNKVGAPFILMKRIPGHSLDKIWNSLSMEHKMAVLTQIAGVLAKMSSIKFDKIGCLWENGLGPFLNFVYGSKGPFTSTYDFCVSFLPQADDEHAQLKEVKSELKTYLMANKDEPCLHAPYHLIHPDLDGRNMLFVYDRDSNQPPQLSGIVDWEHTYTGPLYYLYEYPIFIQESTTGKKDFIKNRALRSHFAYALEQQFPAGSADALAVQSCLKSKRHILGMFLQ